MKRILFVRHGACEEGDVPMQALGIAQSKKLAEIVAITDEEYAHDIRQMTFCSTLIRGFQTASIINPLEEPIIALTELRFGSKIRHEMLDNLFIKIQSISEMFKKDKAVIVCHGYLTTIFAEFASEKVSGTSIRGTLPEFPSYASGYSVDMKTGEVTTIVNT